MTSISWLIYFIGIVDYIGSVSGFLMFFSFFGGIGFSFWYFILLWYEKVSSEVDVPSIQNQLPIVRRFLRSFITLFFIGVFLFTFIPNRQTMILIAASESIQTFAKSDTLKQASEKFGDIANPTFDLLKTYIQKELTKQKNELLSIQNTKTSTSTTTPIPQNVDTSLSPAVKQAIQDAITATIKDQLQKRM